MYYDKKIKLYPHKDEVEAGLLFNEDPFFGNFYPENLEAMNLDVAFRKIGPKNVPHLKCHLCNNPKCLMIALIEPDGQLNFDFHHCKFDERADEILDCVANGEIISGDFLKDKLASAKPSTPYRHPFESFDRVDQGAQAISWTVDGIIPNKSLCSIYGSSESLKSFLAIDIGACVATGTPFKGRATRQGPVLYFAPEGSTGVPIRRDAWMKENGWSDCFVPFYSRGGSFCFSSQNDRDYLADMLAFTSKYWQPRLVIFDTLGQSLGDADENSASDINRIARFLNDLKIAHDCSFIWIDHSGHETKRTRGSSAKTGALDAEFFVARKGDQITVTNTKMKDAPRCKPITLEAIQKHNSLILVEAKPDPSHADVLLEIMQVSIDASEQIIREKFYSLCSAETSAAKQKAFKRAVEKLIQDNLISKDEANGLAKLVLKTKAGHTPPLL